MNSATTLFSKVDWSDDASVRSFVNTAMRDREEHCANIERQAEINLAWYRGHQLLRWNRRTSRMQLLDNPYRRVRLVINLMRGLLDGFAAKLSLDKIRLKSNPQSDDIADIDAAALESKVLQFYQKYLDLQQVEDETDRMDPDGRGVPEGDMGRDGRRWSR